MSREIKFDYIWKHDKTGKILSVKWLIESLDNGFSQVHMTGCTLLARRQFTGIKDKYGKEIYSGDIMQHYGFPHGVVFVVEWNETHGAWSGHGTFQEWQDSDVIGNIYLNPDLLDPQVQAGGPGHDIPGVTSL